ncbi:response regulator transcription factor [Planctomycetaceae bacterium SH139]
MSVSRVYIVEDDVSIRDSIAEVVRYCEHDVCCFETLEAFYSQCDGATAGVLLLGFYLSDRSGLAALSQVKQDYPNLVVMMLSAESNTAKVVEAMRLGARNVLEMPFSFTDLQAALEDAVSQLGQLRENHSCALPAEVASLLTDEETKILVGLSEGLTIKQVAARLDISLRTVHYRKKTIFEKLGVINRTEAMLKLRGIGSRAGGQFQIGQSRPPAS